MGKLWNFFSIEARNKEHWVKIFSCKMLFLKILYTLFKCLAFIVLLEYKKYFANSFQTIIHPHKEKKKS